MRSMDPVSMTVCVVVYRSNMFSGLMTRTVAGGIEHSVMPSESFIVSRCMCFISFTACGLVEESFLAPEGHRHQASHIKRSARRGDGPDQPDEPTEGDVRGRGCIPEDLVLGPKTAERNNAADC